MSTERIVFTCFCPLDSILRRLGVRSADTCTVADRA